MGEKSGAKLGYYYCMRRRRMILWSIALLGSVINVVSAGISLTQLERSNSSSQSDYYVKLANFKSRSNSSSYRHVWPKLKFGWQIVVGTVIAFFGAAAGSIGGVGGGGIFVPMLTLIIGFDPKSSAALSKCMIMGGAASTVYYNLRQRHPNLDMPVIDYDLALLLQPMLMMGISIGVIFNVIFADWMVTALLIILFLGTSTKAFFKGVEMWKKETIEKKEAAELLEANVAAREEAELQHPPDGSNSETRKETKESAKPKVTIIQNVYWKELGLLVFVWISFLVLQITKNHTVTCSTAYWVLTLLQIPASAGVSLYEAVSLYTGRRVIASKGNAGTNWKVYQLILYCFIGIVAGILAGLLGIGGGLILGPLFLEMGVPPQVSSATASFAMVFSSSMSAIEYYLLKRFPVPYALYFLSVAVVAAFFGQHVIRKLIIILGRASMIVFVLAFIIFVSAFSLGGVGISRMVRRMERNEYMGFESLCKYHT